MFFVISCFVFINGQNIIWQWWSVATFLNMAKYLFYDVSICLMCSNIYVKTKRISLFLFGGGGVVGLKNLIKFGKVSFLVQIHFLMCINIDMRTKINFIISVFITQCNNDVFLQSPIKKNEKRGYLYIKAYSYFIDMSS